MRLVGVAKEKEDVTLADRAREEDRGGGEEEGALGAESVVSDDELALASIERDGACRLREGEGALGGGDCKSEGDVASG